MWHVGDVSQSGKIIEHCSHLFALLPVGGDFIAQPVQPLPGVIGANRLVDSKEDVAQRGAAEFPISQMRLCRNL